MQDEYNKNNFSFELSLSVLNHLGRNLYWNFVTVLGEAISNSWDACASNIWIRLTRIENEPIVDPGPPQPTDANERDHTEGGPEAEINADEDRIARVRRARRLFSPT